jgi:hypothetical protein
MLGKCSHTGVHSGNAIHRRGVRAVKSGLLITHQSAKCDRPSTRVMPGNKGFQAGLLTPISRMSGSCTREKKKNGSGGGCVSVSVASSQSKPDDSTPH